MFPLPGFLLNSIQHAILRTSCEIESLSHFIEEQTAFTLQRLCFTVSAATEYFSDSLITSVCQCFITILHVREKICSSLNNHLGRDILRKVSETDHSSTSCTKKLMVG